MDAPKTIKDSKLITLLSVLNAREMRCLSDFVHSPFFNKKRKVMTLFDFLKKKYPEFNSLYRPKLYKHLFPESTCATNIPLDDKQYKQLRDVMSDLVGLVQEFLRYEQRKKNKVREKYELAETFIARGLTTYLPELIKSAKQSQEQRPEGEPTNMHDKYLLSETELRYLLSLDRKQKVEMQTAIDNFHHHALAGQLRLYTAAISRENTMPVMYKYPMVNELLNHLSTHDYAHVPIVDAYYRIFMLFREEDVDIHYTSIQQILTEKYDYFPDSELRYLYGLLLNFCNLQVNKGNLGYNTEKYAIYKHTLSARLWHDDTERISRDHFILAVRAALDMENIEGAQAIIDEYGPDLHSVYRQSIRYLARVFLLVTQKNYTEAENILLDMKGPPDGFYYEIFYRSLCIQTYYELSISEGKHYSTFFKRNTDNLRSYIKNAKLSKRNKELYNNYAKILERIYTMRFDRVNPPAIKRLESIEKDIQNPEHLLVNRKWLLEKIRELVKYWNKKRKK